ncbi:hypothetical protein KFZ70_07540 [Tamlana fucoidanivorans]|uniref:HTH luxR-type domain-containing protein n=1 Tax=Allotamlana fucoidanivorans TaxID=2583814 RepID=A0A5C4SJ07_9FLAO|nr:LuxR C-terminal-related transcriptional regulator [Tamlana fucoidanivorans]TNJ43819.1 hypothetical protein FGF67_10655 [Tamlana fucoidanivorans]
MKEKQVAHVLNLWKNNQPLLPEKKEIFLDAIDQIGSLFAIGSYYYYIFNFQTLDIDFTHKGTQDVLGIPASNVSLNTLFELMHPEDLAKMHSKEELAARFFYENIVPHDIVNYKVMYLLRLRHKKGGYRTILQQTRALHLSNDGMIQNCITVHTDVTYLKMPITHQISFVSDTLPCYYGLECDNKLHKMEYNLHSILTNKEKEIIKLISIGETAKDIAEALSISIHTVNTHRKNILKKTKCANTAELMAKCLMAGII